MLKLLIWIPLMAVLAVGLGGSQPPIRRPFDPQQLSGNLSLKLQRGVWKLWEDKPTYQDIVLDLRCDRGQCQPDVWGFAPRFNRDVDHFGHATVKSLPGERRWQIEVDLQIQRHPGDKTLQSGKYTISLIPYQSQLLGNFRGRVNGRTLVGNVTGTLAPAYPQPIPNHRPIAAREHPRLIFRADRLAELRSKSRSPEGKAILARLQAALARPVYYDKVYVPNGGYHGAGYCFLAVLQSDREAADRGWQRVAQQMAKPSKRLLEQSTAVAGVALAYDLCYGQWTAEQQKRVSRWLARQSARLLNGDSPKKGWNNYPGSNWNARARAAAGLAALAIWREPPEYLPSGYDPKRAIALAHRNILRYQQAALGDRGFGIEGDHYTTEPVVLTVLPFIQAYRLVMGEDIYSNSPIEGLIPLYIMRMIPHSGKLEISPYGRHRSYAGGSLLAVGLGMLPDRDYGAAKWVFDRYLGLDGDRSFGIGMSFPYQAIYALAGLLPDLPARNPLTAYERVQVDDKNGFYVFRNRWQGEGDIATSFYIKRRRREGGWSFPDVGSFRLWGLGREWAIAPQSTAWDAENVVVLPDTEPWSHARPIAYQSRPNGSGIVSLQAIPPAKDPERIATRFLGVDYSGKSGAPGLWVLADRFRGVEGERHWLLHTQGSVTIRGRQFTVRSPEGKSLRGTFITPQSVKIEVENRFGKKRIVARGNGDFWVVMTLQSGRAPDLKVRGKGRATTVQVGSQQIYLSDRQVVFSRWD